MLLASASAAVSHSSSRIPENKLRLNALTIASTDSIVWCARKIRLISANAPAPINVPSAARAAVQLIFTTLLPRPNPSCTNVGSSSSPTVTSVQYTAPPGKENHPSTSIRNVTGSTRLRRRLSKIFQRDTRLIGFCASRPTPPAPAQTATA